MIQFGSISTCQATTRFIFIEAKLDRGFHNFQIAFHEKEDFFTFATGQFKLCCNHEFCDISLKVQICLLDQFFDRIKHASSYLKKLTLWR
ncbi:Uncharacterised protein [Mycobacterium tuberculosis]|nr:Uncharacterised protein [Mycobacterium tuberculosis]